MRFFYEFFRQKAPSGNELPGYYRFALRTSEILLAAYFLLQFFLIAWGRDGWEGVPIVMFAAVFFCFVMTDRMNSRFNVMAYTIVTVVWCAWYVITFGWGCGGQHLLLPLLILTFFYIYESPLMKVLTCVGLIVFRMGLFYYALRHDPVYAISTASSIAFQMANSITLFLILSVECIIFSTSIQDTERQLRLDNQELHKEAGTDPLTGLPNRRAMIEEIDRFRRAFPMEQFSVAIADIDYFKTVNDTYGHNCGDYTLKSLADLFRAEAPKGFSVCRWGGEEFCFFMPNQNIDQAWTLMFDLNIAVKKMPLNFEGHPFRITITVGLEEYDFHSTMEEILDRADEKLYAGKAQGRDRVVM